MRACELTPALRQRLDEIGAQISQGVGKGLDEAMGRQAASRFVAWMTDTWTRTMSRDEHGVFVVTGDIPAMWLRDSSAQLWPFLMMCDLPEVARQIGDVIARQWHCIDVDPYANAFNSGPTGAHFDADDLDVADELWERKYEVDSLAFPVDLAWRYWQATGSSEHLNGAIHQGYTHYRHLELGAGSCAVYLPPRAPRRAVRHSRPRRLGHPGGTHRDDLERVPTFRRRLPLRLQHSGSVHGDACPASNSRVLSRLG